MDSNTKLCFVTHNSNKLQEVQQIIGSKYFITDLSSIGCNEDIAENGDTIEENSQIKAKFVWEKFQISCFADDTGLEVDALGGKPGVYSARYAGVPVDNVKNIDLLLNNLKDNPNRKARFKTIITLVIANQFRQFEGIVNGQILTERIGQMGFGYDSVFVPDGYSKTFAEMTPTEKNAISHRYLALQKLSQFLNHQ